MIKKFQVYKEKNIKNVVKQMDKSKIGIAICVDKNKKVVGDLRYVEQKFSKELMWNDF